MIDRSHYSVLKKSIHDRAEDDDFVPGTPEDRLNMMWQLALDAWAFRSEEERKVAESELPRHVIRVVRRER